MHGSAPVTRIAFHFSTGARCSSGAGILRALGVALFLGESDSVLSLLELMNTGGRAILPPRRFTSADDPEALDRARKGSAGLLSDALAAIVSGDAETLAAC